MISASNRRTRGAFTLVELLVVIGIIALLISVLLPALSKARAQASNLKCSSNLRTIGQATFLYANAHKGSLPPLGMKVDLAQSFSHPNNAGYRWSRLILPYMGGKAFGDPAAAATLKYLQYYVCPDDNVVRTDTSNVICSYALNYDVQPAPASNPADTYVAAFTASPDRQTQPPIKITMIRSSAEKILYGERWNANNVTASSLGVDLVRAADLHQRKASNYLYADGHVERVAVKDTKDKGVASLTAPHRMWTLSIK